MIGSRARDALVVAVLCGAAACAAPSAARSQPGPPSMRAPAYRVIDATGAYLAFLDAAPTVPAEERVATFRERVVGVHPELYAPDVIGTDPSKNGLDLDARLRAYIPTLAERAPAMKRLAREIGATLGTQDATFRRVFPDMKWQGTVYFTASIDAFDGATRPVATPTGTKETALLFGIDKIVKLYGNDARIGPLFHHELFHCYQEDVNPSLGTSSESHGMLEPLWEEGLAVYVASRLNPDATLRELTLTEEMVRAADGRLPAIAAEILTQLDGATEEAYRDFFLGSGKRADLPKRVGYYVGLRVAGVVAERHGGDLPALARLRRPQLREEVAAALASLK